MISKKGDIRKALSRKRIELSNLGNKMGILKHQKYGGKDRTS